MNLPEFENISVVVVGDVMLDVYLWGDVQRISPEAPVPVVRVQEKTITLGGAGNVALNLAGLKGRPVLLGIRGVDPPGDQLSEYLRASGLEDHLLRLPHQPTTSKTRIMGQGQQLLRLDHEAPLRLSANLRRRLLQAFDAALSRVDAVVLSDYGKGVLDAGVAEDLIGRSREKKIPVFVDPKGSDWARYRGATCITPNLKEFQLIASRALTDDQALERQARETIRRLALEYLLVTRGPRGLSLFHREGDALHIAAEAREVFDVSGAGDTVIATLSGGAAAGMSMMAAARLANMAAGVVVGRIGTHPIDLLELKGALWGREISGTRKICGLPLARGVLNEWRRAGRRIVFTNGCFDILHIGHIKLLHAAAAEGDKLVVGLNSDASVRRLKGPSRPVVPEAERASLLASLRCVDLVVPFEQNTPYELIREIKPDVLVKGNDYKPQTVVGYDLLAGWGGKLVLAPLIEGISTTRIIENLKGRD